MSNALPCISINTMFFEPAANFIKYYSRNLKTTAFKNWELGLTASNVVILLTSLSTCVLVYALFLRPTANEQNVNSPRRSNSRRRIRNREASQNRIRGLSERKRLAPYDNWTYSNDDYGEKRSDFGPKDKSFVQDTQKNDYSIEPSAKNSYNPSEMDRHEERPWSPATAPDNRSLRLSPNPKVIPRFQPPKSPEQKLIPSTPCNWNICPSTVKKPRQASIIPTSERQPKPRVISQAEIVPKRTTIQNRAKRAGKHLTYQSNTSETTLNWINQNSVLMGNCYAQLSYDQQKVLKAIRDGDLSVLARYKHHGMKFGFNDNNPMREAVLSNKLEILKFLHYDCGIDLNSESGFAIRWAARKDHLEMVEWLCSLKDIDVTICDGEALSWARENYHFSVQEILEGKIRKYEEEKGVAPGTTWKQTQNRRYQKEITRPLATKLNNTSLLTTEFELARLRASAHRKQVRRPKIRDPSFRVPNKHFDESFDTPYIGDNSFLLTPQLTKVANGRAVSANKSDVSFNLSGILSSSKKLIADNGSEDTTEPRNNPKMKDVFAKPVGLGSRSRSRQPSGQRKKNKSPQVRGGNPAKEANNSYKGPPIITPRTKLKNHCIQAANKLGTIPSAPYTEHRKKIARMRREQKKNKMRKQQSKQQLIPESKQSELPETKGRVEKRKIATTEIYESTPKVKRQKIRPRTDGPITRTQQRGFMKMRDKLLEDGLITKDMRRCLKKEETEQIMRGSGRSRR